MAEERSARILILSASVGSGHLRAAEALEHALGAAAPQAAVSNVDVLALANKAFRRLYGQGYLDFANRAPHLLGYVYDLLDRPKGKPGEEDAGRLLRVALERLNLKPFVKLLKSQPWDIVVNTHFLPAEIIASLRLAGSVALPQVTVTTDFMTHRMWVQEPCEHYFTACEEAAVYLGALGVAAERVSVTGIPIDPAFAAAPSAGACRAAHGITGDRPVVLLLSGGFGVGPVEKIFQHLLAVEAPLEVVAVCGRNAELERRLAGLPAPERHRVRVLGYSRRIEELMAAADVIITKPGGLSSAEALACGGALVVVNPIPGQESRNADFLLENGAAVKIGPIATLPYKIETLLRNPGRRQALVRNARRLARPRAAFEIAAKVLALAAAGAR
jgi:processive 1,2-diacylglycerol beta-glucosyltransferase